MNYSNNYSCNHPIHELIPHLSNLYKSECRKVIFYRRYIGKDNKRATYMCCSCYKLRQLRIKPDLIVCHWVAYGDINFSHCEYCKSSLETKRPILQCKECVYSYMERALYERSQGRDINYLNSFAFCKTHQQGIYT